MAVFIIKTLYNNTLSVGAAVGGLLIDPVGTDLDWLSPQRESHPCRPEGGQVRPNRSRSTAGLRFASLFDCFVVQTTIVAQADADLAVSH